MDRDQKKKLLLGFVLAVIIVTTLAFYTDNPREGNGNETSYVEECKPYFLNATPCPVDVNNSTQNLPDNQTVTASG